MSVPETCGAPIRYVTPAGEWDFVLCDLPPLHLQRCDSSQLLLRPDDAPKLYL